MMSGFRRMGKVRNNDKNNIKALKIRKAGTFLQDVRLPKE